MKKDNWIPVKNPPKFAGRYLTWVVRKRGNFINEYVGVHEYEEVLGCPGTLTWQCKLVGEKITHWAFCPSVPKDTLVFENMKPEKKARK